MEKQEKKLSRKAQGEETRAVLIDTGARLFALNGFNGVSMRTLAAEAGVNLATVGYHFGGKAGLYEAILQNLIDIRYQIFPSAEEVQERMDEAGEDDKALAGIAEWYVSSLVRGIFGNAQHAWPAFIISRELAQPSELFPKLEREFFNPSFQSLYTFVGNVLPEGTDHEELTICAHCIIGMIIKFLEAFNIITNRLGWESYEGRGTDKLAAVLSKRIKGFLGLPMESE
ncbi:TetR/AcrR family transcriptional regulator [Salidesulfovibrio onnuriiensis]|uniref:TetR/AcrR family transcriptional regulator n=1 Tax=Salidesulfovibrio onnuriiensis TaxID=2583823 RepID=UPI0011C9CA5B|nr:CerR family C-terminal domain-containing protein [Salidesulfovibrio onnuriiensis]